MNYFCDKVKEVNKLEKFDLTHLKDVKNLDWVSMLKAIAQMSEV
jgi:hypothetical protein